MEKVDKKSTHLVSIRYILLYFLIYAFIGWLLETVYAIGTLGHFVKRGFLYGPLCPIYGWGAVILVCILQKYKSKPLKLFFYSAIVFSVFEYVAGFALDALFSDRWWDYTNDFMNLNGRISLFVHPFIEKIVKKVLKKIPAHIQIIVINLAFILLSTDTILSCIRYLKLF